MAINSTLQQALNLQNYSAIHGMNNVFCSNLIHFGNPPSFQKIVRDYKKGVATKQTISFKNRDFNFAIYKYAKYKYFNQSITAKNGTYDVSLTFVSPFKWDDPCESVFYQPNINIGGKYYDVKCICTTLEPTEGEEAAWKRNESSYIIDDKTIRVAYGFMPFCELLEQIGNENGVFFYLSMADYSESRDYFKMNQNKMYNSIDDYICDLSKKRKAFAYENEMRVFVVREVQNSTNNIDDMVTFLTNIGQKKVHNLFLNVTLPPLKPFPYNSPQKCIYGRMQDIENFELRIQLLNLCGSTLFQNKNLRQCHLYEINGSSTFATSLVNLYRNNP